MKLKIVIFILVAPILLFGQGEANNWFFGNGAGLNFNSSTPTPISGSLSTYEGCSSFSDKNGNLLFYSDGSTVWNKNHQPMPNGIGLKGHPSSTQSAMIIPKPLSNNLYYIFTVGARVQNQGEYGFNYYTVDMNAQGGLGDIISGPIDLSQGNSEFWTEKVAAVKGKECNTYWVVSLVNNTFYSYKVDSSGVNLTPTISIVNYFPSDVRGYLKVSPNGKKIASATYTAGTNNIGNFILGNGKLHLYSFNDLTGEVSNKGIELISNAAIDGAPYGVEFSSQSNMLYISTFDGLNNKLYQFDLKKPDIASSKILINSELGYRGGLQLAPNGKIFVTIPENYDNGTQFLDAINKPDEQGKACDFQNNVINLRFGKAMQGLPPFIASLLLPIEVTDGVSNQNINKTTIKKCVGDTFQLSPQNISGSPIYKWSFNNQIINTSVTLDLGVLDLTKAGVYFLEVETTDDCGFPIIYKGEVTLEVYNPPSINILSDIYQCDNDNDGYYKFNLKDLKDLEVLNGQSSTEFQVLYFTSQVKADIGLEPIIGDYTNLNSFVTNQIFARIQNKNNPICYKTATFNIHVFEQPNLPTSISNLTLCDSNTTGTDIDGIETFDLTLKKTEILSNQVNQNNFIINYYEDSSYSTLINNPTNFKNETIHTIYFEAINQFNVNCISKSNFNLEVYSLPIVNLSITLKQCDEDGVPDGFTDFNLDEANEYLTNGDSSLIVSYFLTYNHANSDVNKINAFPFSNRTQSKVFARIKNNNGCFRVSEVNLLVSSTSFPANYLKTVTHCDDDNLIDNKNLFHLTNYTSDFINLFPTGQNLEVSYYRNLSDAQLEQNKIDVNVPFLNEIEYEQTLYVRVESSDNGECFGLGPYLKLIVNPRPEFELLSADIFCKNLPSKTVSISNPKGNYTYEWKNENGTIISNDSFATINKEGTYMVIATSINGCKSFPQSIQYKPSIIASVSLNNLTIIDNSNNNSIKINNDNGELGIGDYEYALDNDFGSYQDEPYFEQVEAGVRTLIIRDKNNCGQVSIEIPIIGNPGFMTPNGDGYNDTWQIQGISLYPKSQIYIFDRYGKVLATIDSTKKGWDGTYKGKQVDSGEYWFSAQLDNGRIIKGHFSLIRR